VGRALIIQRAGGERGKKREKKTRHFEQARHPGQIMVLAGRVGGAADSYNSSGGVTSSGIVHPFGRGMSLATSASPFAG